MEVFQLLMSLILFLAIVSLIAASSAIALQDFRASDSVTENDSAYNITTSGLKGIQNASDHFDVTGTIGGITVLIGIVIFVFVGIVQKAAL